MKTALEQNREDQALGAAWRRCELIVPEEATLELIRRTDGEYTASVTMPGGAGIGVILPNPSEALIALAIAFERDQ